MALNLNLLAAEAAKRHADLQQQAVMARATAQAAAIARLTLAEPAVLLKPGMAGALTNGIRPLAIPVVRRRYDR